MAGDFDSKTLKIAIVAGEASGDMLGASLMDSLSSLHPDIEFEGLGGPRMCACGFNSLYPMETLSVMGFIEPLKRLPELLRVKNGLVSHFSQNKPDVFIGIDSPDFNLRVERPLKAKGIPTVHYVSPSVWAWRQGRVKNIRKSVDLVLCLLPFEAEFYRAEEVPVAFVGHPMADEIDLVQDKTAYRQNFELSDNQQVIGVLPGSRASEIEKIAPVFFEVADKLVINNPGRQFLIPAASEKLRLKLIEIAGDRDYLNIVEGQARQVLGASDAAMVASGTATLEAMLMKCPMVVAYKVDALTYAIGKMLVKTDYLALANLVAGKGLVNERIQSEARVETLVDDMEKLLQEGGIREDMLDEFKQLHSALRLDASRTAANAVLSLLRKVHGETPL